jgi:chromate transporter
MMSGLGVLLEIFLVVLISSLFSVGGGNGPTAVIQDRWVGHGVLDPALFSWALALGYLSPGPKAGFLAGIGYYMAGVPGALVAIGGIALPTLAGSAAVSYAYRTLEPVIRRIALPASFVVAGMIAAAAWDMALPMHMSYPEIAAVAAVALLVGVFNLDAVIVVLGAAAGGFGWWLMK